MSTGILSSDIAASTPDQRAPDEDIRLTFPRIVRSEWIKFRTLRSTLWALAVTFLVIVGIVTLFSAILASQIAVGNGGNIDGTGTTFMFSIAANLAQLAVVVLGVLIISSEYSTGMVRSTLAAVPKRLPALWAKGVVLAAATFLVSTVAVGISLGVMQLFLGNRGLAPSLGDDGTARILMGVPLYLTAIALLSFAIAALLRHSAGALATVLGLLLVIENLFLIPWKPLQLIGPFLPGTAGSEIVMPQAQLDSLAAHSVGVALGPWQGYGVLLVWVVALLATAAALLKKRDA